MIIVTQHQKRAVNFDQVADIFVVGYAVNNEFDYKVRAFVTGNREHVLGRYLAEDAAVHALEQLVRAYAEGKAVFYMPQDDDRDRERWMR